jgi:DeoR/GlpR family transcriptional regulator of sugar metabolism
MFREERLRRIIQMITENGTVHVPDVADRFGISASTVRLDLKELERRGLIVRTHGGAIAPESRSGRPVLEVQKTFPQRLVENITQKEAIGKAAADLIGDGETIMIDGGTTTRQIFNNLVNHRFLILVTNVVNTYPSLVSNDDIRVVLTGGELEPGSMTLVGEVGQLTLSRYRASKAILGTDAVSALFGITTLEVQTAALKKCMIENSDTLIVVADSSKINKVSLVPVAPLTAVDILVTDDGIDPAARAEIENLGVQVIAAPVVD